MTHYPVMLTSKRVSQRRYDITMYMQYVYRYICQVLCVHTPAHNPLNKPLFIISFGEWYGLPEPEPLGLGGSGGGEGVARDARRVGATGTGGPCY